VTNDAAIKAAEIKRPRILLIDEVDVFFNKDFYGNSYYPCLLLNDENISKLIEFIWTNRRNLDFNGIKNSSQFNNCLRKFNQWKILFEETVKDMLSELEIFKSGNNDYVIQNDKIGYKEQDSISFDLKYGYKTLFAYLHEHENGKISLSSLNENKNILIKLGSYSYAEIPNNNFYAILGVTGTLETLTDPERSIIENTYKIKHNTFIPSVYGRRNITFEKKEDILIENHENHFKVIANQIEKRILGKNPGTKRAVFVVFENKNDLCTFYDSDPFVPYKRDASILTEENNEQEKKIIINSATCSEKITLFTKIFGRGTDFVVRDQIVSANGGAHVIQTFLSDELSEETQIMGRTARQGEDGSYNMIISKNSLEKYGISQADLDANSNKIYDLCNEKRNKFFKEQYSENTKYIGIIKKKHEKCMEFVGSLFKNDQAKINEFLVQENRAPINQGMNSKTLILLDGTFSMAKLLEKTKKTLNTTFERVADILKERKREQSFQIKIAVYRNYNSTENMILEQSGWENKPEKLIEFLRRIYVSGGWGNEAIEIGLWQANQETDLSQVILIGNSPANTREDVKFKRQAGKFKSEKYKEATYYLDEVEKLNEKNVKIHAFYVDKKAKDNFNELAQHTNSLIKELDINSTELGDSINMELLRIIGGVNEGADLVRAYKTRYNA
jgi:methanogenic corrinoid protein MtbC1